jgi:CBS domain-containing protein
MKVKDAMHKGVDWVSPDTPITEIAKLMRAHDIGCIPIGEDDKLVGMVTDRDIVCKGLAGNGFDASRAKARDVMTEGIHCCREDDDLAKAVHHMETLKVRRLPVINKSKRMVGMISLGDVSQFYVRRSGVRLREERCGPSLKRRPVAIEPSETARTCSTANGCGRPA